VIDQIRVRWFCGGMKHLSILITLLVISSLALSGKVYPGLKVKGDYKNLNIIIEDIPENAANLTEEKVVRAVKLRLFRNGIKTTVDDYQPHYLYVNVNISNKGTFYGFDIQLWKYAFQYGLDDSITGFSFMPNQGGYGSVGLAGQNYNFVIQHLEESLDVFILDYLESNME